VELGVSAFVTDDGPDPARFAAMLEERGYESFFVPEHTHIPARRVSRWPGGDDPLPRAYSHSADPFLVLALAAGATTTLRLGTAVLLLAQRDPIVTAKEVATLDHFSGGRVVLGVGSGWNREEAANHRLAPADRVAVLGEHALAMKEIWHHDPAEFHGRHVGFDPIHCHPKPARRPHPPILVGGWGPTTFDRILRYGDGWLAPRIGSIGELAAGVRKLTELAAGHGRPPLPVTAYVDPARPGDLAVARESGVSRALLDLTQCPPEDLARTLDEHASRTREVLG
jgi:probable F420-dependent oxidoreductase